MAAYPLLKHFVENSFKRLNINLKTNKSHQPISLEVNSFVKEAALCDSVPGAVRWSERLGGPSQTQQES